MPRLSSRLERLDTLVLGQVSRLAVDGHTDVKVDAVSGAAIISITSAGGVRGARIVATWDQQIPGWGSTVVDIWANADPTVAARLNRILGGKSLDNGRWAFPHVETYHRTGQMVVRSPGRPRPVPVRMARQHPGTWRHAGAPGEDQTPAPVVTVSGGIETTQTKQPDGSVVTTSRVAPSASIPTAAPAPPQTTVAAPSAPIAPTVAPEPPRVTVEAPVTTYAPIKVSISPRLQTRPACGCKGTCLFTYHPVSEAGRIVVSPTNREVLSTVLVKHRNLRRRQPATLVLVGPKGTGKTELVADFAAQHGLGLFTVDGAGFASFTDWVGGTGLVDNGQGGVVTRWRASNILQAARIDGPHGDEERIILVDEVNRSEVAGAVNALVSILTSGTIYVPEGGPDGSGETVRISRNVLWAFTMNRGSAYVTTNTLDAAIADRLQQWLMTDYLPQDVEANLVSERTTLDPERSRALVNVATQIRAVYDRGEVADTLSTRRLIDTAEDVVAGMSLRRACEVAWANYYSSEGGDQSERHLVLTTINAALPAD